MAKPRKSVEALKLSGTYAKNPGRYKSRHEPVDDRELGDPPDWLKPDAHGPWREFDATMPWLRYCHRGIVGITALLTAKMAAGELGLPGMNLLRQCLAKLGGTPEAFARIGYEAPAGEENDTTEKYFR